MKKKIYAAVVGAFVLGAAVAQADQGAYPQGPIRLVLPYSSGGLTDNLGRLVGRELQERLGQSVVVENKTGAAGMIAMTAVAKTNPDGYTLIMSGPAQASINQILYKDIQYDTLKDFDPITTVANFSLVMLVNNDSSYKVMNDFKSKGDGELYYGSAGNATTGHLVTEMLREDFGDNLNHVPFQGESQALLELMAGRIDFVFSTIGTAMSLIKANKLRPIAVTSKERSDLLPDVPSLAEDFSEDFNVFGWYAILAPKGADPKVLEKLYKTLDEMKKDPEYNQTIVSRGMESSFFTPDELKEMVVSEKDKWEKIIVQSKIKAN